MTETNPDDGAPDLEAWLDDLSLPEVVVEIYGDRAAEAEFADLERQLDAVRRADDAVGEDDRGMDHGGQAREIAERMQAVSDRMARSLRLFRLRGLSPDEVVEFQRTYPKPEQQNDLIVASLHRMIVSVTDPSTGRTSKITETGIRKLRSGIGSGQFQKLIKAATEVTHGQTVNVPFSYRASSILKTGKS